MPTKVVFITSHPIQYQVPVFRQLASTPGIDLTVLFAQIPDSQMQGAGFGVAFKWDIPLLEGYHYELLNNISKSPSVTSFRGCDTPDVYAKLGKIQPDLVVINGWVVKTCLQALFACKRLGLSSAVRGEANLLRPRVFWKRLLQRLLVRGFDYFLPIGAANRRFYQSYGIRDNQMFPAPYCIENSRFEKAANIARVNRAALREQWRIPKDALCLLYCGKFESKKHPVELIHAFKDATAQNPDLHLLMVGDGELRSNCEELVNQSQLPVTFTGFLNQSQIVEAYVAADILVVPSDHGETWGLVVNEAMACGTPAIVSNLVGCNEDLVERDVTGWTFPFGDWNSLTALIIEVSNKKDQLKAIGENCRIRVSRYTPEIAAQGIAAAASHAAKNEIYSRVH